MQRKITQEMWFAADAAMTGAAASGSVGTDPDWPTSQGPDRCGADDQQPRGQCALRSGDTADQQAAQPDAGSKDQSERVEAHECSIERSAAKCTGLQAKSM